MTLQELSDDLYSVECKVKDCFDAGTDVPEALMDELDNAQAAIREYYRKCLVPAEQTRRLVYDKLTALWPGGTNEIGPQLVMLDGAGERAKVFVFEATGGGTVVSVKSGMTITYFNAATLKITSKQGFVFLLDGDTVLALIPCLDSVDMLQ